MVLEQFDSRAAYNRTERKRTEVQYSVAQYIADSNMARENGIGKDIVVYLVK